MLTKKLLLALAACCTLASQLNAQPATPPVGVPVYTETLTYIKILPGKGQEWLTFVRETSMKAAQMRANKDELVSWTLLQSVYPSGQEATADYIFSVIFEGEPRSNPLSDAGMDNKAGVAITTSEANANQAGLSTLITTELWRPRIRVGAPAKGHYLFLNFVKVHDEAKYADLETTVYGPMTQEWVGQGAMSGCVCATKILPTGSEVSYTAYTADMFPTMEAAFARRQVKDMFEKVVTGKKFDDVSAQLPKIRDLVRRQLWTVVEHVTKQQ